jgi:membrane protease subunit HflK
MGDLFRRIRSEWSRRMRGGRGQGLSTSAVGAAAGVVFMIWALTGFYIVQPNQEAIVTQFGAFARRELPGLRYHLPAPIERAELVNVTSQQKTIVGGAPGAEAPDESLMLTGDENIVDLSFAVQWHISDAAAFLFQVRDPEDAVKAVAESAMREVVGRSGIDPLLTGARQATETEVLDLMQKTLDRYGAGIQITEVKMQKVDPPSQVIDAFRDVQAAVSDAERAQNEAQTYASRVVPDARGRVANITQSAEAYKEQTVAEATGQTSRFLQVLEQYRKAPDVTRERLYLETMEKVLGGADKVIVDKGQAGVVPYLPLPALDRRATPGTATPSQPSQNQSSQQLGARP